MDEFSLTFMAKGQGGLDPLLVSGMGRGGRIVGPGARWAVGGEGSFSYFQAHNAVMLFIFVFFFTYLRKTTFFAKNNRYSTEYWWAHP